MSPGTEAIAAFVAGVVVGEGTFGVAERHSTFRFAVTLGAVDRGMCDVLHDLFGVGNVYLYARRKPDYDDEVTFQVRAFSELINIIVPFMDEHLPPSYKRRQYEAWKTELLDYWEHRAKRVRPCTEPGCEKPRRAKGLCRHHYYEAYGR